MVEPIALRHPTMLAERLRGSGRLQASSKGMVEETAFYFMLSVSGQWGLANRVQTIVFLATFGSMHQAGIYVLWEPNDACNCCWEDLFGELTLDKAPFTTVPFIRILSSSKDSYWGKRTHNNYSCLGNVESHAEYSVACDY